MAKAVVDPIAPTRSLPDPTVSVLLKPAPSSSDPTGDAAHENRRGHVIAFSGIRVMFIPFAADVYGYDAAQTTLLFAHIGVLGVVDQGVLIGRPSSATTRRCWACWRCSRSATAS